MKSCECAGGFFEGRNEEGVLELWGHGYGGDVGAPVDEEVVGGASGFFGAEGLAFVVDVFAGLDDACFIDCRSSV